MGAKAVEGLTWRSRRTQSRVPPRTRLKRRGRLRMRTRWATPRRAAELLLMLLQGLGPVEPSGRSGNRRLGTSTPPGRPTVLRSGSGCAPGSCHLCWTSGRKGGCGEKAPRYPPESGRSAGWAEEAQGFSPAEGLESTVGEAPRVSFLNETPAPSSSFPLQSCFARV